MDNSLSEVSVSRYQSLKELNKVIICFIFDLIANLFQKIREIEIFFLLEKKAKSR
jgi:hypothetical protein